MQFLVRFELAIAWQWHKTLVICVRDDSLVIKTLRIKKGTKQASLAFFINTSRPCKIDKQNVIVSALLVV